MRKLWIILILIAGGVAAVMLDMPAYHFVDNYIEPHGYDHCQIVTGLREFAQTIVPLTIIAAIWRMDRRHGKTIVVRMFLAFVMVLPVTNAGKLLVGRYRPEYFRGSTWADTWIDFGYHHREGKEESFFSGHSSAAFTIAVGLSAYYPPLTPIAYTLATGCALSRVVTEDHWFSDIYLGSLSGIALGWLFLPPELRRRRRDRNRAWQRQPDELTSVLPGR